MRITSISGDGVGVATSDVNAWALTILEGPNERTSTLPTWPILFDRGDLTAHFSCRWTPRVSGRSPELSSCTFFSHPYSLECEMDAMNVLCVCVCVRERERERERVFILYVQSKNAWEIYTVKSVEKEKEGIQIYKEKWVLRILLFHETSVDLSLCENLTKRKGGSWVSREFEWGDLWLEAR